MISTAHDFAGRAIAPLLRLIGPLRESRRRWQRPLLLVAIAAVLAGCAASLDHLDLRWSDVRWMPLVALAAIAVPFTIVYSALNMMLMGHAAKVPLSLRHGVKVSVFAQLAELLPIPGGAIIRGASLVRAGSSPGRSAELVIAFSLLWIACGAVGAGFSLARVGWPAHWLAGAGAVGALAIGGWLAVRFGLSIALGAALLRLLGVALLAWRCALAFAAIGVAVPWIECLAFAFTTILGSAASLIPAGLGVSEGLAALIAKPAGIAPAAAFLAAALSRLLGFTMNVLLAFAFVAADKAANPELVRG